MTTMACSWLFPVIGGPALSFTSAVAAEADPSLIGVLAVQESPATVWHYAVFVLIALIGLLLSAVFSGMETGVYTLNRVRMAVRAGTGDQQAMRLRSEFQDSNRLLGTLLIGNNIANYLGSYGIAAILATIGLSSGQAVIVNAAILVPLLFVFAEVLPKDLFRTYTDDWTYRWSAFLTWVRRLLTWVGLLPIVQLVTIVLGRLLGGEASTATAARERIGQLIKEGIGAGVLTEMQTTVADRALAMRDLRVRSVMVPWADVYSISIDADHKQRMATLQKPGPSHIVVLDRDGRPVGCVKALDLLLNPHEPIANLMTELTELRPTTALSDALWQLRAERKIMAVVRPIMPTNASSPPLGIVTPQDMVRPLIE